MEKKIVFIDMDGVIADFFAGVGRPNCEWNPPEMFVEGFFRNLPVMPGAKRALEAMSEMNELDLYIASKPTTRNLHSTVEKYQWIEEHFPWLLRKIFLTCDKSFLNGDILIDDDKIWKDGFKGTFVHFERGNSEESWQDILNWFSYNRRHQHEDEKKLVHSPIPNCS
jgi:5'(3')-deoxyribonucleotidase